MEVRGQAVCPSLRPLSQFRYPGCPAVPRVVPSQGPYGHSGICSSVLARCHSSTIVTSLISRAVPGQMFCLSANSPFCFPPSAFLGGLPHGKSLVGRCECVPVLERVPCSRVGPGKSPAVFLKGTQCCMSRGCLVKGKGV